VLIGDGELKMDGTGKRERRWLRRIRTRSAIGLKLGSHSGYIRTVKLAELVITTTFRICNLYAHRRDKRKAGVK